jgi:hypothetical protein
MRSLLSRRRQLFAARFPTLNLSRSASGIGVMDWCSAVAKLPAFQFYPGDWLKDPSLSMCAPATRGIWIDLMCAMHELGRIGQVTGTVEQLCRISRCNAAEMTAALEEIKATKTGDIAERNGIITVICRRMKREAEERVATNQRVQKCRSNGDVTALKRESNAPSSSSSSSSVSKTTPSRARGEIPPPENPRGEIEDSELEALAVAVQQVTGVKPTSWQLEGQIRTAAIELRGQGFRPDEVIACAQQKGKTYRLKFVAQDLATDRQQLTQAKNGTHRNHVSAGAAALADFIREQSGGGE